MEKMPKVLGKIHIPDNYQTNKCICDECGNELDDSWGDPRVRVKRVHPDGKGEIIMICHDCDFEMFWNNPEPDNIFE